MVKCDVPYFDTKIAKLLIGVTVGVHRVRLIIVRVYSVRVTVKGLGYTGLGFIGLGFVELG